MKRTGDMYHYVSRKYNRLKQALLTEKRKADPNAVLTDADGELLNQQLQAELEQEILQEKRSLKPSTVVKAYSPNLPSIRETSFGERRERREKHARAVKSYVAAQVRSAGYLSGYGDFQRPREYQWVTRALTPEERTAYASCSARMDPQYYEGKGLTEEQVKAQIAAAAKERTLYSFKAITHVLEQHGTRLGGTFTDEELIQEYPNLVISINIINEAHMMLKDMTCDEVTAAAKEELAKEISGLMGAVPLLEKRMALMADPFYPDVLLESILEVGPAELDRMTSNPRKDSPFDGLGVTVLLDSSQAEGADPAQPREEPPRPRGVESVSERDNILGLLNDISFAQVTSLDERAAAALGMSYSEFRSQTMLCTPEGKLIKSGAPIFNALDEAKGVLFVLRKDGNGEPVPLVVDPTRPEYTVQIGTEAVTAAVGQLQEPVRPGRFAGMINWISKRLTGERSDVMAKYHRDLERYQAAKAALEPLTKGKPLPPKVREQENALRDQDRAAQFASARESLLHDIENCRIALENIPLEDELHFHIAMGRLLAATVLTGPTDSPLYRTMYRLLGAHTPDFKLDNNLNEFLKSDIMHEFAWSLGQSDPGLLEALGSGDKARVDGALATAAKRFTAFFGEQPEQKKASPETAARKKALYAKGELDQRDNAARWDNLMCFYGPVRRLRPEWVGILGSRSTYNIDDWRSLQRTQVDLSKVRPENEPIDDRTFASLGMLLSLRRMTFFTPKNMGSDVHMPNTMPFEDIVIDHIGPRANSRMVLEPIVEPTRKELLNCLNHMNSVVQTEQREGEAQKELTGKHLLAKRLAESLHLYSAHLKDFSWTDRPNSVLTQVCGKAMEFATQHGMLGLLEAYGLSKEDLEAVRVSLHMGEIINEGLNAEADLTRDQKRKPEDPEKLTEEQRQSCIDKLLRFQLMKADAKLYQPDTGLGMEMAYAQRMDEQKKITKMRRQRYLSFLEAKDQLADLRSEIQRNYTAQQDDQPMIFSPTARNLLVEGTPYMKERLDQMLTPEQRRELAKKDSGEILNALKSSPQISQVVKTMSDEKAKYDAFEARLDQLAEKERDMPQRRFDRVIPRAKELLRTGPREEMLFLIQSTDEQLAATDQIFQKNPKTSYHTLIQASLQKQQEEEKAREAEQKAPRREAPQAEQQAPEQPRKPLPGKPGEEIEMNPMQ